ncbi:MAG: nucleoside monophosphate kinase [Candidatus Saccharibacteria bacterium]|nr:nucleoside monophosphate kinase [Candidatus Saccharibacteria bacterium]
MEEKLQTIRNWLGTGSINIFGIQFSGKDTLGVPLADKLGAEFVSSGDIARAAAEQHTDESVQQAAAQTSSGDLMPTNEFCQLIVPFLKDSRLDDKPLVLGSVGRWIGEEDTIMQALDAGGHQLKAVLVINIPEAEVWRRWEEVKNTRNGGRADDVDRDKVQRRLDEFYTKTEPVIAKYRELGYVVDIDATGTIPETFEQTVDKLYRRAIAS